MEYWPDIIAEAAKSSLGILALMILVISGLAMVFFRRAPIGVRVFVFVLMFAGVVAFGYSARQVTSDGPPRLDPGGETDPTMSVSGAVSVTAYNQIQDLYLRAKRSDNCAQIRTLVARIEALSDNTRLVPGVAIMSVRYPSRSDEPTIAELSLDRVARIKRLKSHCFH